MNTMSKLALWHWHIELSSKCTLRCPRCAREEEPESLVNAELSLEFIQRNFTPEFIRAHVEKITFCGDDGDVIYAKDFVEIVKYIKSVKPVELVIVTNGSYKKENWWKELGKVLTSIDHINFSIDGWDQASNEQYRVNSDWESIMLGLTTLREASDVFITWATIVFAFNEHHIQRIIDLANEKKCDTFQLTKSTKFHSVYPIYPVIDLLQPTSPDSISSTGRFNREFSNLSGRVRNSAAYKTNVLHAVQAIKDNTSNEITPLCQVGNKGMYISSLGRLYPCCWVANRYKHNDEWSELSADLNKITIVDALNDEDWREELATFRWHECKTKCNSAVATINYCTEW